MKTNKSRVQGAYRGGKEGERRKEKISFGVRLYTKEINIHE